MSAQADLQRCLRSIRQSFEIALHARHLSTEAAARSIGISSYTIRTLRAKPYTLSVRVLQQIAMWADDKTIDTALDGLYGERATHVREAP